MYELKVRQNPDLARAEEIPVGQAPKGGLKHASVIDPSREPAFDRLTAGTMSESNARIL